MSLPIWRPSAAGCSCSSFSGSCLATIGFDGALIAGILGVGFALALSLFLIYAVVRAMRDLVRQPDLRTATNIAIAVAGWIGLGLVVWWWYWSFASHHNPCFWCMGTP